jgi:PspC domain
MATDPQSTRVGATSPTRVPRRDDGKVLAGVCTGLGAWFGIDPNLLGSGSWRTRVHGW